MTDDERIDRLEQAVACLGRGFAGKYGPYAQGTAGLHHRGMRPLAELVEEFFPNLRNRQFEVTTNGNS